MANTHNVQDAALRTTKVLPAANAENVHDWIDLRGPGNAVLDRAELVIELPATPSLVEAKTVTLTVEDSALGTDGDDAALVGVSTVVATGAAAAAGGPAITRRVKLPSITRRYVRVRQAVLADGGDNTAISITASVRF